MGVKVLQVLANLEIGGLENVAMDIFRELRSWDVDVDFLVYGDNIGYYEDEVLKKGGHIFHIDFPSFNYVKFYLNIKRIIKENGPYEIVYSHTYFNSGIVLRAAKNLNVKVCVSHCHSSCRSSASLFVKRIYNTLMRNWVNKYADVICACSEQAGENMFGSLEFHKRGIVLPNRIQLKDFLFVESDRWRIRQSIGVTNNQILFGTVGHLTSAKNHSLLLRVFAHLYGGDDKYKLLIVGDGELRCELEQETGRLGITTQVCFLGTRTDVGALLSAMDLFLLTSLHEGLGIVLLEAQANGLPCVGIRNVIAKEAIVSSNFVLVDCMDDFSEWERSIRRALAQGRVNISAITGTMNKQDANFREILTRIICGQSF